jgi:NodT family efflux transporter outer membrane factor (OMF) lipoprotein
MTRVSFLFLFFLACVTGAMAQQGGSYLEKPLPQSWNDGEFFDQTLPPDDTWWLNFEDPVLDSLIVVACKNNYSVLGAMENIRKARATWRKAQGGLMPSFDLNLGWQRDKTSGNTAQTLFRETWEGQYAAAVSMKWQADIFGSIYMRAKAQKQLFMATEEEFNAVMVSLVANVAITYFSLRQSLAEMQVIRWNVESQREIMDIVVSRYNTGLASKLDVSQSRSVYYNTRAKIPAMQATIEGYRNAMAVLLGLYPQELQGWLEEGYALPEYMAPIEVGVPASLLLRRPDIRAAERQVEANASLLGATRRDWFPSLFLTGSLGFASEKLKYLPRSKSLTWEIAPSLSWNIFTGTERVNATREARATLDQSIASFNSTMLNAMQEVENAMSQYRNSIEQIITLRKAMMQNEETLSLSLELYKQGLTEYQNVLDAQRSLFTCQDYLVQAHGASLIYLVQLYEALGGGW